MANFGKDTIGGSTEAVAAVTKRFWKFTAPSGISTIDEFWIYCDRSGTGTGYAVTGAIYTDNAGAPNALVADSVITVSSNISRNTPQWYSVSYSTKPTLTPGNVYWIGALFTKASITYYSAGSSNQQASRADTLPFDDPFGGSPTYAAQVGSCYLVWSIPPILLVSSINAAATESSALTTAIRFASSVACAATVAGALLTGIPLTSDVTCAATTEAALTAPSLATFPTVESLTPTENSANQTNYDANLPATVNDGDLLVAFGCVGNLYGAPTLVTPSGWEKVGERTSGTNYSLGIFVRHADGTEGSGTVNFDFQITCSGFSAQVFRISGWRDSGTLLNDIKMETTIQQNVTSLDPPSLAPEWGTEKILWIAGAAGFPQDNAIISYSENYTDGTLSHDDSRATIATERRELEASSEDPGVITFTEAAGASGLTLAIRPAEGGATPAQFASDVSATATVAGALTTQISLVSTVSATATQASALTTAISLSSPISATATTTATLTTTIPLQSAIAANVAEVSALTTAISFKSDIAAAAAQISALTTEIRFQSDVACSATTSAELIAPAAAIFPTVESVTETVNIADQTIYYANLPATVDADDLLIAAGTAGGGTCASVSAPSGWTKISTDIWYPTECNPVWFARIADGTEGGGTVEFNFINAQLRFVAQVYRIKGWYNSGIVANDVKWAGTTGTTQYPDPPNLAPGWYTEKILWITFAWNYGVYVSAPTNYDNVEETLSGESDYVKMWSARRELEAASENPGTWSFGEEAHSWATTLAVRPAPSGGPAQFAASINATATATGTLFALTASGSAKAIIAASLTTYRPWYMPIPAAVRTVNVSTVAQLVAAVNDLTAGDHIVIAAGTYDITSEWSGTLDLSGKPACVIKAASDAHVQITSATDPSDGIIQLGTNQFLIGIEVYPANDTMECTAVIAGTGSAIINCHIFCKSVATSNQQTLASQSAVGGLIYGNLIHDGRHVAYLQNSSTSTPKWIAHNYLADPLGTNTYLIHVYTESADKSYGMKFYENILVNGQSLIGGAGSASTPKLNEFYNNIFYSAGLRTYNRPQETRFQENKFYASLLEYNHLWGDGGLYDDTQYPTVFSDNQFYDSNASNKYIAVVTSYYPIGGGRDDTGAAALRPEDCWDGTKYYGHFKNSLIAGGTTYSSITSIADWRTDTEAEGNRFDIGGSYTAGAPPDGYTLFENVYDENRALLVVENWSGSGVEVTTAGDLYNPQDPWGTPLYEGPNPTVTDTGVTVFLVRIPTGEAAALQADVSATATQASGLTTSIRYASSITATATASAALTVGGATLQTSANATATASTALTTAIKLVSSVSASATETSALITAIRCAAGISATATSVAALTGGVAPLQTSVTASATTTVALTTQIRMAAVISATATKAAALTTSIRLASGISTSATTAGAITTAIRCASSITATATASAPTIRVQARLKTDISATAAMLADLTARSPLISAIMATATSAGAITTAIRAAAAITATASTVADLTGGGTWMRVNALCEAIADGDITGGTPAPQYIVEFYSHSQQRTFEAHQTNVFRSPKRRT